MLQEDKIRKYCRFIGDNDFLSEFLDLSKDTLNEHTKDQDSEEIDEVDVFIFRESPSYIEVAMRDYQVEGLNWLVRMHENQINSILADEMGLGKTLQTISLLGYLKYIRKENHTSLIIVPKSTLQNWKNEFKKFMPNFKVKIFHSSKKLLRKESSFFKRKNYDACVTTYEMCLTAKRILKKVKWSYVIIDEAHRIKNENSVLSTIVRLFSCKNRLLLTGTPLQNNIKELWALLNFIVPEIFTDSVKFEKYVLNTENQNSVDKLRKVLQLFFLRREKVDVEKGLMPKKIVNLYVKLTELQREWYKSILKNDLSGILGLGDKKSILLNIVMQLRKCCNHPYIFPGAEPGPPFTTDEHLIYNCGKMILVDKLLKKFKEEGSRVLIFCQMTRMIDILEDYCVFRGYDYCRIDGSTVSEDRNNAIEDFNRLGSDKFVFLLTTRAGGLGINLATADKVILYDTDWNPQADLQAQDRAHRIGQKKQVWIYKLITENTIEEKIVEKSLKKLKLDEILIQKKKSSGLNQKDLLEILVNGVDDIMGDKDEKLEIDEDYNAIIDIDEVIKTGEEKTKKLEQDLECLSLGDSAQKQINAYEFEGENYNLKKLKEIIPESRESKRRKISLFGSKMPEIVNYPFYQFYPIELKEIQEKEMKYFKTNRKLSEEEEIKKAEYIKHGFSWTKKDFNNFIKATVLFGKNNHQRISEYTEKPAEEIEQYANVFWKRTHEVPDFDKIISQIEKSESQTAKNSTIRKVIADIKEKPDYRIPYLINTRSKFYPEFLDMFLLEAYIKHSDSANPAQSVFIELRKSPLFQFNYFIKTRNPSDLMRRITTLINGILKSTE